MSRYIDADALIMALRLEYPMMPMFKESQKEWAIKTEGYRKAEEVIKDAPSIDIVRCKECTERDDDWCMYWQNVINVYDFCSYGERKESE